MRVADAVGLGGFDREPGGFGVARCRHQHAGMCGAGLAGVEIAIADHALHRDIEVGVVEDDRRRLAAEFQRNALDRGRSEFRDTGAGAGRTGEGDHVDLLVRDQGFAHHRAVAGDQVEDAGRHAGGMDDLGQQEGVERRDFRGLEHHGAAGGECRGDLGCDLVQRVIPGRDGGDDADRLRAPPSSCRPFLEGKVGQHFRIHAEAGGRRTDLDALRKLVGHAHFQGDGLGDLIGAGLEAFLDFLEVRGALGGGVTLQASKARRAAITAASASAALPCGTVASRAPSVGEKTSMLPLPAGAIHWPSM
jgi:hypothetical protein